MIINEAIQFATKAHERQTRKGSDIPYILHCLEAGTIAAGMTYQNGEINEDVVAAAILHDTIEDANISYGELKSTFNENVADLVNAQSEDKSKTWTERKEATMSFLRENESRDVEIATLADKLSNMRAMFRDHLSLKDDLWSKFNAGKESQHWYYKTIGESFSQIKGTKEHDEYEALIKAVFES